MASKKSESADFVISRVFEAKRERVWKAWTDLEQLKQWWGPKGFLPRYAKVDLRPGGTFHYCLRSGGGQEMWGKFTYREIVAPERLVFVSSFSDEAGGTTRHPMHQSWPLEMLSTITFEDEPGGKTKVTIRWQAHNATAEEQKTFDTSHDGMRQGWGGTLDQLEGYLAKARK